MPDHVVTTQDGVPIAVYELGGDGPPLLIAHATGFHGRAYTPFASRLSHYFRCIAYDERGHGESGLPPELDFDWRGFGLDVLAVVDGLGLGGDSGLFGFGHSCGGAALLMAEEERPGLFGEIFCFEPIVFPGDDPPAPEPGNPLAEGARRRRPVFETRHQALDHYGLRPPLDSLDRDSLAAYVEYGFEDQPDGTVRLRCDPENEARIYACGFSHRTFSRLAEVQCPVTIATGGNSQSLGRPAYQAMVERLVRGHLMVMPGLGHFGPMEDPREVATAVEKVFRETPSASSDTPLE